MPAKYQAVFGALWDRRFRQLSPEAKIVAFYVMTGPRATSEGLYQLPLYQIVGDTDLSGQQVDAALAELDGADLVRYDDETEVVLDRLALRTCRVFTSKADNRVKAAVRLLEPLPSTPLLAEWLRLAEIHQPTLAEAVSDDLDFAPPLQVLPRSSEGPSKDRGAVRGGVVGGEVHPVQHETACPDCGKALDLDGHGGCPTCDPDQRRRA